MASLCNHNWEDEYGKHRCELPKAHTTLENRKEHECRCQPRWWLSEEDKND